MLQDLNFRLWFDTNIEVKEAYNSPKTTIFSTKVLTFSHSKTFYIYSKMLKTKNNYSIA